MVRGNFSGLFLFVFLEESRVCLSKALFKRLYPFVNVC
jgi:hypothetical protein